LVAITATGVSSTGARSTIFSAASQPPTAALAVSRSSSGSMGRWSSTAISTAACRTPESVRTIDAPSS
jgi:hypothetical protein